MKLSSVVLHSYMSWQHSVVLGTSPLHAEMFSLLLSFSHFISVFYATLFKTDNESHKVDFSIAQHEITKTWRGKRETKKKNSVICRWHKTHIETLPYLNSDVRILVFLIQCFSSHVSRVQAYPNLASRLKSLISQLLSIPDCFQHISDLEFPSRISTWSSAFVIIGLRFWIVRKNTNFTPLKTMLLLFPNVTI